MNCMIREEEFDRVYFRMKMLFKDKCKFQCRSNQIPIHHKINRHLMLKNPFLFNAKIIKILERKEHIHKLSSIKYTDGYLPVKLDKK